MCSKDKPIFLAKHWYLWYSYLSQGRNIKIKNTRAYLLGMWGSRTKQSNVEVKDPEVYRMWHKLFTHKLPSASSNFLLSLNFYSNSHFYLIYCHSLQTSLVPRHNKMTRMWDWKDGPASWVSTCRAFAFLSLPFSRCSHSCSPDHLQNFTQSC